MAGLELKYEVHFRDQFGQFKAACDAAATRSVKETADDLRDLAADNAPVKSGDLRDSIRVEEISSRSAAVGSSLKYARPQEEGGVPHAIDTTWPYGEEHIIQHPGNPATHFLKRAVDTIMPKFLANMKKNYPG